MSLPSRRSFGVHNSPDTGIPSPATTTQERGRSRRESWLRSSLLSRLMKQDDEASVKSPNAERPPIPSALHAREPDSTPLPILSMIVLSITMLGEFLSANVAMPFLLFMVKGFKEFEGESDIAFYTGIIVAAFFLTQFLTSLLWATVADKHGRRTVLTLSLFGSAVTVLIFGTTNSLRQAIAVRLLQGIFAGAVGVARGCVASVTDVTNEGRAYAIMGFCWGFGGVAGAIIGGAFERPAEKWPDVFGHVSLFVDYPYLLPCAIAGSITLFGSLLSLFLGPDGGPREGAIRLPPEKLRQQQLQILGEDEEPVLPETNTEQEEPLRLFDALKRRISQSFARYTRSPSLGSGINEINTPSAPPISSPRMNSRRTSRANGSAYGYSSNYSHRLPSSSTTRRSMASTLWRRRSNYGSHRSYDGSDLNFTQRLLMANENAVTNIADLWVAAAMNVDVEEQYDMEPGITVDEEAHYDGHQYSDAQDLLRTTSQGTMSSGNTDAMIFPSTSRRISTVTFSSPERVPRRPVGRMPTLGSPLFDDARTMRRSSGNGPSIFAHPGVRAPAAVLDAQLREAEVSDGLSPILERRRSAAVNQTEVGGEDEGVEKQPPLTSQLPVLVIIQYGLLALHSTTHDQVFLSYLVSDYQSGGLNLNAGHFSQLIALMCLFQIVYQFHLYPNIGPPRGRFSHMAMFRLGSLLFIPAYLSVIMYRVFASSSDDGNIFLMAALALSTAIRYCGNTFAYTAVSILLNYMTPPAALSFANGVAQSIVSLARCFGPILGGYLWSASTQNNPSGYPLGFLACAGACALAVGHSLFIR